MRPKDAKPGVPMPRNTRAEAGMPAALTCADVRAREWDFVEGVLPIPARTAVQAHLDACESCRREMMLCRSTEGALLTGLAQIPSAGDLRTGFYARLAEQQRRPAGGYGRPAALSALAVGILALTLLRPALQTRFGQPAGPGERISSLAFAPLRPALEPALRSRLSQETPLILRSVPGLSETQVDRLLASVDARLPASPRHRGTRRRPIRSGSLASVARRPSNRLSLSLAAASKSVLYAYYDASGLPRAEYGRTAKTKTGLPVIRTNLGMNAPETNIRDRQTKFGLVAAAMPSEAGVSLEVTDEVRGFSNTTHVASDIEVQGETSTIHVAADGN